MKKNITTHHLAI